MPYLEPLVALINQLLALCQASPLACQAVLQLRNPVIALPDLQER